MPINSISQIINLNIHKCGHLDKFRTAADFNDIIQTRRTLKITIKLLNIYDFLSRNVERSNQRPIHTVNIADSHKKFC